MAKTETYLSQFYKPLDLNVVFKDFEELGKKDPADANHYLKGAILCDPFVLAAVIWPKLVWQPFHRHYVEHLIYPIRNLYAVNKMDKKPDSAKTPRFTEATNK